MAYNTHTLRAEYFRAYLGFCDRAFLRYLNDTIQEPTPERFRDPAYCAKLAAELRVTDPSDEELIDWHEQDFARQRRERDALLQDLPDQQQQHQQQQQRAFRERAERLQAAAARRDSIKIQRVYLKKPY